MAVSKILAVCLVVAGPCAWTTPQFSISSSTTPVPILRYIDNQNTDGSYTYGFEGGDGTYKLETRYTDGRVKGKYGYYDPEGVLREATYGAEAGRGFEPEIQGVDLPPPTIVEEIQNEIPDSFQPEIQNQQRFKNFKAQSVKPKKSSSTHEKSAVKIVNGRRAVLKKRLRAKATPAPTQFVDPQVQRENNLRAREEQLKSLRDHRQQLLLLQQGQSGARQSSVRSFSGFRQTQQETVRSSPTVSVSDPYVRGLNLADGSYSYSYGK
eukprot:TRINITY_DN3516_c0_g1_i1.p1 TRINITY_DN3516_c0_g1~~TRINITY_DN3516_c0_g1_i1.p1  ORF type:complete len:266 (-),score=73.90 TRINITY_DN3516_c0_g1_i1:71-868(-)